MAEDQYSSDLRLYDFKFEKSTYTESRFFALGLHYKHTLSYLYIT